MHKVRLILAKILLLCFAAGQLMVFAHQHNAGSATGGITVHKAAAPLLLKENCPLCDAIHHINFELPQTIIPGTITSGKAHFKPVSHYFAGKSLPQAGDRGPPSLPLQQPDSCRVSC